MTEFDVFYSAFNILTIGFDRREAPPKIKSSRDLSDDGSPPGTSSYSSGACTRKALATVLLVGGNGGSCHASFVSSAFEPTGTQIF